MPIVLAGVVSCKKDLEAGNLDKEHGSAEDMAGWVRGDSNRRDCMGCMVIDGFDLGKRREMIGFGVLLGTLFGGG